jgi:hypothetical protein
VSDTTAGAKSSIKPVVPIAENPPLLLYSAVTYLKFRIQELYRGRHYVWCSPVFEAGTLAKYQLGAGTPPSSDPASICRRLHAAVTRGDDHDEKIESQKSSLLGLAVEWSKNGEIAEEDRDEITAIVTRASFKDWRPLLFVIPYEPIQTRVSLVPRQKRASLEPEYIIEDLVQGEFNIIEPIAA